MIIPIDDKTRVAGTDTCWQLETYTKKSGWVPKKYYSTLRQALSALVRREIRTDPAQGIAECEDAAERIVGRYSQLFDELER